MHFIDMKLFKMRLESILKDMGLNVGDVVVTPYPVRGEHEDVIMGFRVVVRLSDELYQVFEGKLTRSYDVKIEKSRVEYYPSSIPESNPGQPYLDPTSNHSLK